MYGNLGYDELEGGGGPDALFAYQEPTDFFFDTQISVADTAGSVLRGGNGNDFIFGSAGHDDLFGGNGHDELWGFQGQDLIEAGNGNDLILPGGGLDQVFGEAGDDIAVIHTNGSTHMGDGFDRCFLVDSTIASALSCEESSVIGG